MPPRRPPIFKPPPRAFELEIARLREQLSQVQRLSDHRGAELQRLQRRTATRNQATQTERMENAEDNDTPTDYLPGVLADQAAVLQARRTRLDDEGLEVAEARKEKLFSLIDTYWPPPPAPQGPTSSSSSSSSSRKRPLPPGLKTHAVGLVFSPGFTSEGEDKEVGSPEL